MRIHPVSDLHLEWSPAFRHSVGMTLQRSSAAELKQHWGPDNVDLVIAAGDIHLGPLAPGWLRFLYGAKRILYVPGNHEYYGHRLDQLDGQIQRECERHGVDFLQCSRVEIDGVVFLGATLWTDFAAFAPRVRVARAGRLAEETFPDYDVIQTLSRSKGGPRKITWRDILELHRKQLYWLEDAISRHQGQPLVVVTHHSPSLSLGHPNYRNDAATAAICSRLDNLVERSRATYWICGHSHWPMRVQLGQTLVVNNSCGFVGENMEDNRFDGGLVLEI